MRLSKFVYRLFKIAVPFAMRTFLALAIAAGAIAPAIAAERAPPAKSDLDLSQYKGKVVYLDFWASWCAPCAASFPYMEELEQAFGKDGLQIITVNLDHSRPRADAFLARMNADLPVVYDPKGDVAAAFHVKTMPTSILIGRDGLIRYVHAGFHDEKTPDYDNHLRELLGEK